MSICKGCGMVIGRDCFNPQECEWISRDIEMRATAEQYTSPIEQQLAELRDKVESLEYRLSMLEQLPRTDKP